MMKSKKILGIVFSFVVLSFVMTSFVSASFGDWVRGLFSDEPKLAPFNATVTIQGVSPVVKTVFNVTDDFSSSFIDQVQVNPGAVSNVYVTFLAHDDNGAIDLPVSPNLATNLFINITYGGNRVGSASYIASGPADSCVSITGCTPGGTFCDSNTERIYFCNLSSSMQFYYQPNVNASPVNPGLWTVGIRIVDGGALSGRNTTKNFTYLEFPAVQNIVNLTWVGISPSATNQKAAENVTIINKGNRFINSVNMTAYNLTGSLYPTTRAYIPASAIRSYGQPGSECADPPSTTLVEDAGLLVNSLGLDFGAAVQNPLRFCIYPSLAGLGGLDLTNSPYIAVTGRAGTQDWRINYGA